MSTRPAIEVAPAVPRHAAAVRGLRVTPAQAGYVGDIAFNLADAEANPRSEAMAILHGGVVIGFYRLDRGASVVAHRPLQGACIALRAFLLDRGVQGRGLATGAIVACCADVARRHPDCRLLALNVDCRNVVATRAYRRAGFVDSGELLAGGRAGPQRLMLRRIG